jgi:hypothetical protein
MTNHAYKDGLPPIPQDEAVQGAVLASLLAEHPTHLTLLDLYRERDPEDLSERDAVDRAVQVLVSAGLLHRNGVFIVPSRAALHFERLSSL